MPAAPKPKSSILTGKFALTSNLNPLNGNPNTGVFDPVVGVSIGYRLAFDIASQALGTDPLSGDKSRVITTGPVKIQFTGATTGLLANTLPATLNGAPLTFRLPGRGGT